QSVRTTLADDGFRRYDQFVFIPVGHIAESGQEIATRYRNVNRLMNTNARFAYVSEIRELVFAGEKDGRTIALVFLDDFIGTGTQARSFWTDVLSSLVHPSHPMYFGAAVACREGIDLIEAETPFRVTAVHYVQDIHFLTKTNRFSDAEKNRI